MNKFKAMIFDHIDNIEREVDLQDFTGLKLGQRVTHANAGQFGGATKDGVRKITESQGTVIGFDFQGSYSWGGACVTVNVQWDDGQTYNMVYSLAKKVA